MGANTFGNSGAPNSGMFATGYNPQNDITAALVAWVEQGIAPQNFTATKYVNNTSNGGIQFQRTLCKVSRIAVAEPQLTLCTQYPAMSRYNGGDVNAASSWGCV